MSTLAWIIIATILTSALALLGIFSLLFNEVRLKKLVFSLVAMSAGALIGGAFLHLLPESIELAGQEGARKVFFIALAGFIAFFTLEQFIHWHHCHRAPSEHKHPVTYLVLISDSIHNFVDGLAIGSAFVIDVRLGIVTTLAIAAHEFPQELGDFGILIHGGWERGKALLFNFLTGLTMVAGGILAWLLSPDIEVAYLLPFAAGNFIYIAAADLIPEIKYCETVRRSIKHFLAFFLGLAIMYALLFIEM